MADSREDRNARRVGRPYGRRRAPYALRACDACRQRKGRCDGRQPCQYCSGRNLPCSFSNSACYDRWEELPTQQPEKETAIDSCPSDEPLLPSAQDDHAALLELVSNLQSQLDGLASRVGPSYGPTVLPATQSASEARSALRVSQSTGNDVHIPARSTSISGPATRPPNQRFCGPTSPDYSLNIAQMRIRQGSSSEPSPKRSGMVSMEDEALSDDGTGPAYADEPYSATANVALPLRKHYTSQLFQIISLLDLQRALSLLRIYQDVVGDLHPFVDVDDLTSRLRRWYSAPNRGNGTMLVDDTDADHLVIANLTLAIALRAESSSTAFQETRLVQSNMESIITAKLVSPASSIKDVEVVLLAGLYYYFQDVARSAWRMCGIAGNMLRELGFHRAEVIDHVLDSDTARQETGILIGSVLILDRQWSATTGLPSHFDNSSFDLLPISRGETPYLKSMLAFLQISDKFNEPISSASRGEWHDDEDGFEVMDFQIEQWRKKSVGTLNLDNVASWYTDPASRPPSWAILLNLRAASVRSLLWRPFFFSETVIEIVKERLVPALELVSYTMNALSALDTTSDIYRKQHPFYQHVLASSSALLFLLIAYIDQNKSALLPTLSAEFGASVARDYRIALGLARNYTRISSASRRLHKRLLEIGETLKQLRMVGDDRPVEMNHAITDVSARRTPGRGVHSFGRQAPYISQAGLSYTQPMGVNMDSSNNNGFGLMMASDTDMQTGWAESLLWDWQGEGLGVFGGTGDNIS